jgi:Tetracyclin repressor-like, C-terminal domain
MVRGRRHNARAALSFVVIDLVLCDHRRMTDSAPRTARERARAEITAEILDAARGYMATDGAPADTVRPASRVTRLLLRIIVEAAAAGRIPDADVRDAEAQPVADAVAPIRSYLPPGIPAPLVQRALMVWTNLFGVVSFELFGQLHNVVAEPPAGRDVFFAECIRRWITFTAIT